MCMTRMALSTWAVRLACPEISRGLRLIGPTYNDAILGAEWLRMWKRKGKNELEQDEGDRSKVNEKGPGPALIQDFS
jgi:hypothetical protein